MISRLKLSLLALGSGATLNACLIASAMILGIGTLQIVNSYKDAMTIAYKAVETRGRSVASLTDASIRSVDLVVSTLAGDLTSSTEMPNLSEGLDRRLQQVDQVSDLVVIRAGRRWEGRGALRFSTGRRVRYGPRLAQSKSRGPADARGCGFRTNLPRRGRDRRLQAIASIGRHGLRRGGGRPQAFLL